MKFSINKTELQNAISIVMKGTSNKLDLPILSGIFIDAHADSLTFQTTDGVSSIKYEVAALVEEEGRTVVPAKLFNEVVKSLDDAAVRVLHQENEMHITCETSSFSIKTMFAEDFPAFPNLTVEQSIEVPFPQFSKMVSSVATSVSKDALRMTQTGILVSAEEGKLRLVGTDSYRLALAQTDVDVQDEFEAIIPGDFLQMVTSLIKTEDPIKLMLSENQVAIASGSTVFVNRRIEGTFPDYKRTILDTHTTRVEIDINAMASSVKRIALLTPSNSLMRIDINNPSQSMRIDAMSADIGSAQETITCAVEGDDLEIGFNARQILDGLNSISKISNDDKVYFDLISNRTPGVLRTVQDDSFIYVIAAMHLDVIY